MQILLLTAQSHMRHQYARRQSPWAAHPLLSASHTVHLCLLFPSQPVVITELFLAVW